MGARSIPAIVEEEYPSVGPNEICCEYCFKVSKKKEALGWMYFSFQYLKPAWLCNDCSINKGHELQSLQFANRERIYVSSEIPVSQ